ncbi:hypothetical protein QTP88_023300 [Uroleucon formosanum]
MAEIDFINSYSVADSGDCLLSAVLTARVATDAIFLCFDNSPHKWDRCQHTRSIAVVLNL